MFRTVAGTAAAAALAAVGGMHVLWTVTPWPWDSSDELRSAVFGSSDTDVPLVGYVAMGGVMVGAGALVLSQAHLLPRIGSDRLRKVAMYALSAGLFLRGAGGFALNAGATDEFRHLNTVVYIPLCLGLAALTFYVQRVSHPDAARLSA